MAPRKRAPRDANTASKVLPSVETDGDPASPLRESSNSNSDETRHHQRYKSWTPAPSIPNRPPRDEEERTAVKNEYLAWARKHFGERWYELDEARESEKDHLKDPLKFYDMFEEMNRIEHEKRLEHEREKKAALGRAYVPNWLIPLSETDSDPASPHHDSSVASDDTYRIPFSDTDSDKSKPMPEDPWERLEYARTHLHLYQTEEEYREARARVEVIVEKQRKEKELERIKAAEEMAILRLRHTNPLESERRMRVHRLRYKDVLPWGLAGVVRFGHAVEVLTEEQAQEQIEAEDREEAAAQAAARERWKPPQRELLTQEELDAKHRTYDAWGISREEQAKMFGLKPELEPGIADAPASERVSQPRASSPRPPKDTSRKTRGGRITKSTAQIQSVANRSTRSRQTAPTPAEVPMPDRQSKQLRRAPDKPDDNTAQVPPKTRKRQPKVQKERASDVIEDEVLQSKHHNTRQRKVYKKERSSQRLAERSVALPLHEPPLRNPSNGSKPYPSGLRNRAPPKKKSIAVKGAKPRGISKSGHEGTNRPKRSKKRSED
jgi:hypothetical protein